MKIMIVIGTRPEIVKMAPIIDYVKKKNLDYVVIHSGQHYSNFMSEAFISDLELPEPDENLGIGSGSQAEQTAKGLVAFEKSIIKNKPDVILVQGDTNSAFAAGLAGAKIYEVKVGHVEAGLRSYDLRMPEEYNRRLLDHMSDFLFAPTSKNYEILKSENVFGKLFVTGNTVIDACIRHLPIAEKKSQILSMLKISDYVLLTLHRAENVDDPDVLKSILSALFELDEQILFPAHPRTVNRFYEFNLMNKIKESNIRLIQPVSYLDFLILMKNSKYIITDSGGIQEEATAPNIRKRVFVVRDSTERQEAVDAGFAVVVGTKTDEILRKIHETLNNNYLLPDQSPFGDGTASKQIIDHLLQYFN